MTNEDSDEAAPTDEELPDNVLFDLYETYVGDTDKASDVYLGFGLFFTGVALAIGALAIFVYALSTTTADTVPYFRIVEWAFGMGILAIPVATSGIVVLLPIDERAVAATAVGDVFIIVAVVSFRSAYWGDWGGYGSGQTVTVLGLYAVGLTLVVGSTGAALVAEQIQRATAPHPSEIQPVEDDDPSESYSDAEIRSDIDEAMQDVEMSWGGVRKHEGKSLSFDTGADIDAEGFADADAATTKRSSGVDNQLSALQGLRGGQKNTAKSSSTVDDQTKKLQELREQKQSEDTDVPVSEDEERTGFLGWLRNLFG
jgi:hypothetical protein